MPRCRLSKSIKIWKNFSGPTEMKKLSWVNPSHLSKILGIGIKINPLSDFLQQMKFAFNIMGSNKPTSYRTATGVAVPDIVRLSDKNNYWYWRVLIQSYLEAIGLWSDNAPVDVSDAVHAVFNISLLTLVFFANSVRKVSSFCWAPWKLGLFCRHLNRKAHRRFLKLWKYNMVLIRIAIITYCCKQYIVLL